MEINKDLAFDIGAYTGDTVPMIKSLGFKKIVCFEPSPQTFSILQANYGQDPEVVLVNKAISDKAGNLLLTINLNLPWINTLEEKWITGTRHEPHYHDRAQCTIEAIKLDTYIESLGEIPSYIKLDVEGHELSVFSGLSYKPDRLSFEWITEFPEKNVLGLVEMKRLGFTSFQVCYKEDVPTDSTPSYDFNGCIERLRQERKNDIANEIGGNIWCR